MKCYLDKNGNNIIEPEEIKPIIAQYLMFEIRSSIHRLKNLIRTIQLVENQEIQSFGEAGNAYFIEVHKESLVIGYDYAEIEASLNHNEVIQAFSFYLNYLVETYESK